MNVRATSYMAAAVRHRSFLSAEGIFFAVGGFIRRSHSFDEGGSSGPLARTPYGKFRYYI